MPTYCYTNNGGATIERVFPIGKAPRSVQRNGVRFARDIHAEHAGVRHNPGNWPMTSYAAGVGHDEVAEFMEIDKAAGVETEYSEDGDPIFTSAKHRTKYCKTHGLYDRNAGFSDPAPVGR